MQDYCCQFKCVMKYQCDSDFGSECDEIQCQFQYDCEFCQYQDTCDREDYEYEEDE